MLCVIPNALLLDFVFLSQQTHLYILPSALSVLMIINVLEFLSVKNRVLIIIVVGNQSHKYWYKPLQLGE